MAGTSERHVAVAAAFIFLVLVAAVAFAASLHTPSGPPVIPTTDHGTSEHDAPQPHKHKTRKGRHG